MLLRKASLWKTVAIFSTLWLTGCATVPSGSVVSRPGGIEALERRWIDAERKNGKVSQEFKDVFYDSLQELLWTQTELEACKIENE